MIETLIVSNGQRKVGLKIFDRRIGHFQMDWLAHQFSEDEPSTVKVDGRVARITSGGKLSPFKIELMS